jgi:hypothetical protein
VSHITTVKTNIDDINALDAAAKALGLKLSESNMVRGYSNQKIAADVVWNANDKYDVGAVKQPDGTYALVADWWGVGYEMEEKLLNEYAVQKTLKRAKIMGHKLKSKTTLSDGTVEIRLVVN